MKGRSGGRASWQSIPIVKCELCGWDIPSSSAVLREVDGIRHYFCSTDCESEWERLDVARVRDLADPKPEPAASK